MTNRKSMWDPAKGSYSSYLMAKGEPEASLAVQKGEKRSQERKMQIKKTLEMMRNKEKR